MDELPTTRVVRSASRVINHAPNMNVWIVTYNSGRYAERRDTITGKEHQTYP